MAGKEEHNSSATCSNPQSGQPALKGNSETGIGLDVIEFFDNLNWNPKKKCSCNRNCKQRGSTELMQNFTRSLSCKEELNNSYAFKLINSNLSLYPETSYRLPAEGEEISKFGEYKYVPGVKDGERTFYPEFSKLKKGEMTKLHILFLKRCFKSLDNSEMASYQDLMAKATGDHQQFQHFVMRQWLSHHFRRCLNVPESVLKFIDHFWKLRVKQSLTFYPSEYKSSGKDIPLTLNDPFKANAVMDMVGVEKVKGGLQLLNRPYWHRRTDLETDFEQLCKLKPDFEEHNKNPFSTIVKPSLPASLDPEVQSIILNKNIDVVITSSGIKTIVENSITQFREEWILPVIIKDVPTSEGKKKVVIIDKNLPPVSMSTYDKSKWHAKIASRWALIPNWMSEKNNIASTKEFSNSDLQDEDNLQRCGNTSSLDASGTPTFTNAKLDHNPSKAVNTGDAELEDGELTSDDNLEPRKNDLVMGKKHMNNSKNQIKTRFVYKLWDLHKSSTFAMSKQEQRNLRVLTRTRIDGKLQHRDYNKECLSDVVCLSSRLEFQPEYGVSVVEPKELIREYVDLYLRSHAKLCRVRCVGHTQEVMMTEVKTLQEVRECMLAQKEKIDPKTVFDPLYAVLTHLVDQPAGRYLLRHTPRTGSFAQLLPAAGDQRESLFRLSHEYSSMKESDVGIPPRRIDIYTVTAIHSRDRTLPGLFKPMPDVDNRKHLKKPTVQMPPKIKMNGSQRKKIRRMKAQMANELKEMPDLNSMSISQAAKP